MTTPTVGFVVQPMGSSPEQIDAEVTGVGAALHVVLDDPKPITAYRAAGAQVIFRRASDDHAHEKTNPVQFVQELHRLAPAGAWLHLGNEPGTGNLPLLNSWTLAALKECRRLGRIGVAFNFSTGEPERAQWAQLDESIRYLIATGQYAGVHEYFLYSIAQGMADGHIGRVRVLKDLYPTLNVCLTELGMVTGLVNVGGRWIYNADAGWAAGSDIETYAAEVEKAVREVYAPLGVPAMLFIEGMWWDRSETFDTRGQTVLHRRMQAVNEAVKAGGVKPVSGKRMVQITSGSPVVNVRALPSTGGKILMQVPSGTVVWATGAVIPAGGAQWAALDLGAQTGYIALSVCQLA